jgi:hypothetical protein
MSPSSAPKIKTIFFLKRWSIPANPYSITIQKKIVTAVKTQNLTKHICIKLIDAAVTRQIRNIL